MEAARGRLLRGTLTLLGTIVGAGCFALPAAFGQLGILSGSLVYWTIALVILSTHLLYVETILAKKGLRTERFPTQVTTLLGRGAGKLAFFSHPGHLIGASIAYILLGGDFLFVLAQHFALPGDALAWRLMFWIGGGVIALLGLSLLSKIESLMTWALIVLLVFVVLLLAPGADPVRFFETGSASLFAPLGVFVFSMFGLSVIAEVGEVCGNDPKRFRVAVGTGSLGAALLMWLFGVFVYAASGDVVVSKAGDVARLFPAHLFWLMPTVGFLAIITSFITMLAELTETLRRQLKISSLAAWVVAMGVPLFLALMSAKSFVSVIGIVGSFFVAGNGLLASLMAFRSLSRPLPRVLSLVCAAVFLIVIFWRILHLT